MVKGETYDKQLFESEAFRHFVNIFLNKQSGITKGCEITKDTQNITVAPGYFVIQGGLLKEATGTDNSIPAEAGYYKLVYEIDLSKTNSKDEFKQGSYKFVKAIGEYPKLAQEDLDNNGTIYQLPFCQFRITEEGIQDFTDIREKLGCGIYSTEELKTGETWVDGKAIFRKVIKFDSTSKEGQKTVQNIDISKLNIADVIKYEGMLKSYSGQIYNADRSEGSSSYTRTEFSANYKNMTYNTQGIHNYFDGHVTIILEYTKKD